jgi:CRP/FNR family cyclic AMP-dependent transcriptional regulator
VSAHKSRQGQTPKRVTGSTVNAVPPKAAPFDPETFLSKVGEGRSIAEYRKSQIVFAQGDKADAVFYLRKGRIKLTVVSHQGKEAVVAILGENEFFGEGCLVAQPLRMATATALTPCSILRLEKSAMVRALHHQPTFSGRFITHLLSRNIRIEEDLVDQLFNSAEKRLARVLLLLANFGKEGKPEAVIPKISQETLADMIGTTRSRVSFFMNKFRNLGFIHYNHGLEVHSGLLNVILHD